MNSSKTEIFKRILPITIIMEFILILLPNTGIEINSSFASMLCIGVLFAVSAAICIVLFIQYFKKLKSLLNKIIAIIFFIVALVICSGFIALGLFAGITNHESKITIGDRKYVVIDRSILFATDLKIYNDIGLIRTYAGIKINTDDGYNPFINNEYEITKSKQNYVIKYHYNGKDQGREMQIIIK